MFGRDLRVPTQNLLPTPSIDTTNKTKTFWKETQKKIANTHEIRKEKITKYESFNTKSCVYRDPFKPGMWVLRRLPREFWMKMSLHFDSPYVVKKHIPGGDESVGIVYVLVDGEGKEYISLMLFCLRQTHKAT